MKLKSQVDGLNIHMDRLKVPKPIVYLTLTLDRPLSFRQTVHFQLGRPSSLILLDRPLLPMARAFDIFLGLTWALTALDLHNLRVITLS